ncbi:DUF4365 domain-containing protein [Chryseobacterium pennipullorum]|uniref:DUF4365 domain-containing protein n=1 Tax=Chryseobacterium pennipullorum TaxID=2258963 RepID=A0A3D9B205_9FLAO|nr:DUF4365 domain-containing protein [Chryseobacterium pennipullorum]REC47569.1 hypothetical protein DRF67_11045 [Chryseobacterium pennipullorum]
MSQYNPAERIGVNAVEGIFLKKFNWIFRDQPISDMGIDAQVEVVANGAPTGILICLQIKTGESHFTINEEKLTYYGKLKHMEYWKNHSLPVLLVAHLPGSDETYWVHVNTKNIMLTNTSWKIDIPKSQKLSERFLSEIAEIGDGTDESKRARKLIMDKSLMENIQNGNKVSVTFMEYLHKSLNRTPFKIIFTIDGEESLHKKWGIAYAGYSNEEILQKIFPWADLQVDNDFYQENLNEESLRDMYNLDWLYEQKFYPYEVLFREAANFRLELSLNHLGKSFLIYNKYIEDGDVS